MGKKKQEEQEQAAEETTTAPGTEDETPGGESTGEQETADAPEPGPLSKLQTAVRELLDFDQITEVRLALQGRREDLEKHRKKGAELGVYEPDTHRRIALLDGSDTKFGLTRIFAREEDSETRDLFFDREKENGRPDGDDTITFRTVDGRDVTCLLDDLDLPEHLRELRALYRAGILPDRVEKAARDGDFWYEVEAEETVAGVGA